VIIYNIFKLDVLLKKSSGILSISLLLIILNTSYELVYIYIYKFYIKKFLFFLIYLIYIFFKLEFPLPPELTNELN